MTARQDEIEVHELALEDPELKEEDFLNQGSGSHFESRVAELVVLIPNPAGLPSLPPKVEQLVAKGFHNIVVGLGGISDLDASGLECLSRSRQVVDTWAGTLRLCEAEGAAASTLGALTGEDAFETFPTRSEAIEAYRTSMNEAPLDPGESQDLLAASGDDTAAADDDANDWGWGSADEVEEPVGPSVEIAEMHVTESELLKLDSELRRVVMGGKKHVSLRLHFSRPLTTDDVDALIGARNYLKREGGLLVLVSLPRDVLKSLRLLDLDKEFSIVEGGGAAEAAHERAAQGLDPVLGGTPAPAVVSAPVAPPTPVAPVAPPTPPSPVGSEIVLEPVSSVELDSGISISEDDLGLGGASSAEVERLRADHGAAQAELARLQQEVAGLRNRLGTTQEERDKAHATLNELQTSLRRNERRVAELEQSQGRAERRAAEAEELKNQVREDTRRLDGELTRLRQELDQAREAGQTAQAQLQAAVDPSKVEGLEREVEARDARIRELEAQLSKASTSSDGANLMERCQALEEEKAKILTEAEAEIQRLSNERQVLREELESAGEMIERLGKELELS